MERPYPALDSAVRIHIFVDGYARDRADRVSNTARIRLRSFPIQERQELANALVGQLVAVFARLTGRENDRVMRPVLLRKATPGWHVIACCLTLAKGIAADIAERELLNSFQVAGKRNS
jgi:hypothetical protein